MHPATHISVQCLCQHLRALTVAALFSRQNSPLWKHNGGNFNAVSSGNANSSNLTNPGKNVPWYTLPDAHDSEAFYATVFGEGLRQGMIGTELDYEDADYENVRVREL